MFCRTRHSLRMLVGSTPLTFRAGVYKIQSGSTSTTATDASLPENWSAIVSGLHTRTDFRASELEDMWGQFIALAGDKRYLDEAQFQLMIKRNFGLRKVDWVKKYFRAFDRNDSGTIDFTEYVLGLAAMGRVLMDKKAHSLIGLSTGANIVRSGRDARLFWVEPPNRVGIIKKWKDPQVTQHAERLIRWLMNEKQLQVFIEDAVDGNGAPWLPECERLDEKRVAEQVDFIITLGGDGTALKAASYFDDSRPIPPTLSFGLGSLGFLAPFDVKDAHYMISRVLDAHRKPMPCSLRTRLKGELYSPGGDLLKTLYSLNEVIVNRGLSGVLSMLEVYVDGHLITTAQGDGLIVATPSGSTAYNISAGGCMVSPLVPATLVTPIAPHSLSFRPILASASSEITLRIPTNARAGAWLSYDAQSSIPIERGSYIKLTSASIPMPTLSHFDLDGDWFASIRDKLHWNLRMMQKTHDTSPDPVEVNGIAERMDSEDGRSQ